MRCEEFEERIHESLDQRIAPWSQETLMDHAQKCSGCRDLLASYEQLSDGVSFFETDAICDGFSGRVVEQVSAVRTRRRQVIIAAAVAAVAAAVLIAVLPGFLWQPGPVDVASPNQPASDENGSSARSPDATEPDDTPSAEGFNGQDSVDIEQAYVFWDQWAARLSPDEWKPVNRIAGEFAPITEPLSVAIEEIRSAIPLGRPSPSAESTPDSADAWRLPAIRDTA